MDLDIKMRKRRSRLCAALHGLHCQCEVIRTGTGCATWCWTAVPVSAAPQLALPTLLNTGDIQRYLEFGRSRCSRQWRRPGRGPDQPRSGLAEISGSPMSPPIRAARHNHRKKIEVRMSQNRARVSPLSRATFVDFVFSY